MADLFFSEYIEGSSNNKALEIYNGTGAAIDLAAEKYVVQTYFNGNTTANSTINLTGTVANGDVFVLAQSSANPTILAQVDQTTSASWFNGDDAIVLRNGGASGTIVDAIGQVGVDPGTEWGSGLTSTADNTLRRKISVTTGDTNPNDAFDPSVEWDGFATDTFDGLGSYTTGGGGTPGSGGGTPDGGGGTSPDNTTPGNIRIHDIQDAAQISPIAGQTVTRVPGIVTATRSNGFYLQDPNPDTNDATSEGIFVFTSSAPGVSVGDSVLVSGTVSEFRPGGSDGTNLSTTQIGGPTIITVSSGNELPIATVLGGGGRTIPNTVIENDASGNVETSNTFDPAQDGIDFYESLEGMLVQVNNAVAVGPTNDFGEIPVLADNGENAGPRTARGGIVIQPGDFNPERIIVDDAIVASEPKVNVSDTFNGSITGVIDYSFGNFKLLNTAPLPGVTSGGLTRETTNLTGDADQLTVATFNVENLDPGDGSTKFSSLANAVVNNLKSPDIISLEEVQDNNGPTNDSVVDANQTYQTLINAIAAEKGGPTYEYRQINPVDDQDGGEPGGNIRVGFLFNPNRVDFVDRPGGTSTTNTTVNRGDFGPEVSASPGRLIDTDISNGDAFNNSRKPLVGEFLFNGETVFVIGNHFNSKGGDQPLFGRFQPPTLSSETQRLQQAEIVNNFVENILATDPNANVAVVGDLNDFQFSPPIQTLEDDDLNNLIETLPLNEQYTYVFEGNSQVLDHILVSDNLLGDAAEAAEIDVVHSNAEFADQVSDHDPLVSRFDLDIPNGVIWATAGSDTLAGSANADTIYGRGGNDTINGLQENDLIFAGNGNDQLLGGNGVDTLLGQAGDDNLTGDNGDDLLNGGFGNDNLLGGRGSDRFVLGTSAGTDTISDFKDGDDRLQLSNNLTFEQLNIAQGTGANSSNTLISLTSNNELLATLTGVQSSNITSADFVG
jgi:hypothetical protein